MNITVSPVLRKNQKNKAGECQINLVVFHQGTRTKVKVSEKVSRDFSDDAKKRVKKSHKMATLINSKIEKGIADIKGQLINETLNGINGDLDVKKVIWKEQIKDVDFFEFCEQQIKEKNYRPETRRAYTLLCNKIKGFKKSLRLRDSTLNSCRSTKRI
jgi:hypothetical protein